MTLRRSLERLLPFITAAVPGGFRIFVLGIAGFFLAPDSMVFFSTQYTLAAFFRHGVRGWFCDDLNEAYGRG